jgi:chemosensory pili system protein ChpA (sensor histidine kinase/response regulator)
MRPFAELTAKLSRALRELTTQSEKLVALEISGTQTLLERTILEALSDPLLHLLRNAFDHGIETPANRQALGKPPTGTITLAASYRGHQTIITLSDDGAGMNTEKIHARAVELGLLTPDTPPIETSDLLNLIFTPGFSTADQITEISGRGMGMDIVRTKIQEVNGRISMATRPRHGTTFTISVPFTLSVLPVLLVESAGMLLAFPTNIVEEILLPTPSMCLESAGQTFLNLDGYLLPFLCLKEWLNFPHSLVRNTRESSPLINQSLALIIANNQELVALKVDAYWGEEEVTLRNIEGTFPLPKGFSNCTILGDGRVVPLLDSATLIESLQTQKLTPITPQDNTFILNRKSTVMVIDDSINVRRFLALTLEKWGYRVQQAKDGQEAMEKLQEGLSPVAVICDLEMPRLDGYGFLAQLRAQPRWQSLPVIMLTSRSGDKHRQLAFTLGASAYFAKPFQEQELLTTLKSLVEVNVR